MHNTDRTALEFPYSEEAYFPQGEYAMQEELVDAYSGEINQDLEVQLAAELLSIGSDEELDQFLGGLVRRIGSGFSRFARSGAGRAVFGALRSAAKAALPKLASMGASMIPGVGPLIAPLAGKAASALGDRLGLEVEGMSNEDSQFEIARRVIRVGFDAARAIDGMPEGEVMDEELWRAIAGAARRWLPRLGRTIVRGAQYVANNSSGNFTLPLGYGTTFSINKTAVGDASGGRGDSQEEIPAAAQRRYAAPAAAAIPNPSIPRPSFPPMPRGSGTWRRVPGGILVLGV
jgi:hypothetical protein